MKNIGKVIVVFTFCIIMVSALLGGCDDGKTLPSKSDAEVSEPADIPETVVNEPAKEPETVANEPVKEPANAAVAPAGNLPDDLYSFTFILDGDLYSLPTAFSVFASNGWKFYKPIEETLDHDRYTSLRIQNDEQKTVGILLVNNSGEDARKPADCDIGGISLFSSSTEAELIFPGNLKIGDPGSRVEELYGEPTDMSDGDDFCTYYYVKDDISYYSSYSRVKITVDKTKGLVSELDMCNFDI
jgi:hypothetical protein